MFLKQQKRENRNFRCSSGELYTTMMKVETLFMGKMGRQENTRNDGDGQETEGRKHREGGRPGKQTEPGRLLSRLRFDKRRKDGRTRVMTSKQHAQKFKVERL